MLFFAQTASAAVFINEIQISPINERFIELYNSDNFDTDITGWYIQRKTATGNSFGSLVTSTQLNGKIIKAQSYFLISRSQLSNSDVVVDLTLTESNTIRVRDSKGKDVDQIEFGSIGDGKSYQKISSGGWFTGNPTPGSTNMEGASVPAQESNTNTNTVQTTTTTATASTLTTPQVTVQAGPQTRVVLAGSPIIFEGKISGLENNYGVVARTTWTFGDGASAEGESVTHTYYYPGEYTAILDVVSGTYKATDRMLVRVVLPNVSLQAGGDTSRSFVTIQNKGVDELDLSGWQIMSSEKTFILPRNTILGARKSATFASEVTGLVTPVGSTVELLFPNGSRVETKIESVVVEASTPKVAKAPVVKKNVETHVLSQTPQRQEAAVINSVADTQTTLPPNQEGSLWPWYIGAAFLGALALLGIRLARGNEEKNTISAEDFEIIEDTDDEEPH